MIFYNDIEYIWISIMSFLFLHGVFQKQLFEQNWENRLLDNGNGNWCMLGRPLFVSNQAFCVEPSIFVPGRSF